MFIAFVGKQVNECNHAIHVISASIRGQGVGRGDHSLRAHTHASAVAHRLDSCFRYVGLFGPCERSPHSPAGLAHCLKCELKDNLWLCLTCGALGCGRQQFGGIGGNGHGLEHYHETAHPVSVKLGTITPEGNAG